MLLRVAWNQVIWNSLKLDLVRIYRLSELNSSKLHLSVARIKLDILVWPDSQETYCKLKVILSSIERLWKLIVHVFENCIYNELWLLVVIKL